MEEHALHRKLVAIDALHQGATTQGERTAAAQARQRILTRLLKLGLVRRAGVHAVFTHAAGLAPQQDDSDRMVDEPELSLPSAQDLQLVLAAWELGLRTSEEVADWAAHLCDRLLLPSVDVHDPRAARVEVLLVLASMERQPLLPDDVAVIGEFLVASPGPSAWTAWFTWLASVDWAARRQGAA